MYFTVLIILVVASFVTSCSSFVTAETSALNVHTKDGTEVRRLRGDVQEERMVTITELGEGDEEAAKAIEGALSKVESGHKLSNAKDLSEQEAAGAQEAKAIYDKIDHDKSPHGLINKKLSDEQLKDFMDHLEAIMKARSSGTPSNVPIHSDAKAPKENFSFQPEGQPHVNPEGQPQTQWQQHHLTPEQSEKSMMNFLHELDDKEIKILENSGIDLDKLRNGDETELLRAVKVAFKAPKRQRPFYQKLFKWTFIATTSILSIYALWVIFVLNPWRNTHSTAKAGTVTAGGA